MPLFVLAGLLLLVLAFVALLPLSLIQRYRMGTSRQQARGWLLAINLVGIALSAAMFLAGALVTSIWIPNAFTFSVAGMAIGCALGLVGLWLTRWESTPRALHYTPNRFLVLTITLLVTARLAYGFWRGWQSWGAVGREEWFVTSGAAQSLGAGAIVLGYYLVYWTGVRRRQKKHARRRLRTM